MLFRSQARPAVVANAPKVNTRKGHPLCVDCEYHSWAFEWMTGRIIHRCHDVMARDPVTGAPTDPYINRKNALSCGPTGTFWRIKSVPAKPREIEVLPDTEPEQYLPPVPVRMMLPAPKDEVIVELLATGNTSE